MAEKIIQNQEYFQEIDKRKKFNRIDQLTEMVRLQYLNR